MSQSMKTLGVFSLVMITVGAVDSVRNLPTTALFGSSLVFFFLIAGFCFLIPSALVSAELASAWPKKGGIYVWIKEAFGEQCGLLAIWCQWIENVIWYPTLLSFMAGTIAYVFSPELAHSKIFLVTMVLSIFWSVTLLNLRGLKTTAFFSNCCAIAGLIIPMALIIAFGALWLFSGKPAQIDLHHIAKIPNFNEANLWVSMSAVILCFCGMELTTVHAQEVNNPQKDFPKALFISVSIILGTMIAGALAIAIVLPQAQISLVAGIMQAFKAFFQAYHLSALTPIMAALIVIGTLGSLSSWIIAPTKGLMIALQDLNISPRLQQENKQGAPQNLLLLQAIIVSIVSLLFILMPTINSAYWILTVLASQLYMIMYFLLFAAGVVLRFTAPNTHRPFRIPGKGGMSLIALLGIATSLFTFLIGFHPPAGMAIETASSYQIMLLIGIAVFLAPPFILRRFRRLDVVSALPNDMATTRD